MPREDRRAVVITSVVGRERALGALLTSLSSVVPMPVPVVVVKGGSAEYEVIDDPVANMVTILAPHNSIDWTGLVALCERPDVLARYDDVWYMHDTCSVGPAFVDAVRALPRCRTASFPFPSMNMGLYSRESVEESRDEIVRTFKNTDTRPSTLQHFKNLNVTHEDWMFRRNPAHVTLGGPPIVHPPRDVYGTGVPRIVEYYQCIDLYKYKANWEVKPVYDLRL